MALIAIEEHGNLPALTSAVKALPEDRGDASVGFNEMGDNLERLDEIGDARIAAMDAQGVDLQILSLAPPGTHPLEPPGRPRYDDLFAAAAALRQPIFIHPQIPRHTIRLAADGGFDPMTDLALATFGLGWHVEAAIAALLLIVRGTFERQSRTATRARPLGRTGVVLDGPRRWPFPHRGTGPQGVRLPPLQHPHHQLGDAQSHAAAFLTAFPTDDDREKFTAGNACSLFGISLPTNKKQ